MGAEYWGGVAVRHRFGSVYAHLLTYAQDRWYVLNST